MDDAAKNALWAEYSKSRSAEIREKLILEYEPTMLLVEHDVRFQEKVATSVVRM